MARRTRQRTVSTHGPAPRPGRPRTKIRTGRMRIHAVEMTRVARRFHEELTPERLMTPEVRTPELRSPERLMTHEALTPEALPPEGAIRPAPMVLAVRHTVPSAARAARAALAFHTSRCRHVAATRMTRVPRDNRHHPTGPARESARSNSRRAMKNDSRGRSRSGVQARRPLRRRTTGP